MQTALDKIEQGEDPSDNDEDYEDEERQ